MQISYKLSLLSLFISFSNCAAMLYKQNLQNIILQNLNDTIHRLIPSSSEKSRSQYNNFLEGLAFDHKESLHPTEKPSSLQSDQIQQSILNSASYNTLTGLDHIYQQIEHGTNELRIPDEQVDCMLNVAPEEILDVITILKNTAYPQMWPNTLLLVGKPGVGKSTFAKIIAQKSDRQFIFIKSATLVNEYQHSGASNIERLFMRILEMAQRRPIVLIFDEINALADKLENNNDMKRLIDNGTSEALWMWLDICAKNPNILVIATTNDAKNLKDQLGSRFEGDIITIEEPRTIDDYKNILVFYLANMHICNEEFISSFAKKLKGLTPREIEKLVKKSCQNSAVRTFKESGDWWGLGSPQIEDQDLQVAYSTLLKTKQQLQKQWYKVAFQYLSSHGVPLLTAGSCLCGIATFILTMTGKIKINVVPER